MIEKHQELVHQFTKIEKSLDKIFKHKTFIIAILLMAIVISMKVFQKTSSSQLNHFAFIGVTILFCWHFWSFYKRSVLFEKLTKTVLEGMALESKKGLIELTYFKSFMKDLNILGEIFKRAFFDAIIVFFFCLSLTHLLTSTNPDFIVKLRMLNPISIFAINAYLIWLHYKPLKSLARLKRSREGIANI